MITDDIDESRKSTRYVAILAHSFYDGSGLLEIVVLTESCWFSRSDTSSVKHETWSLGGFVISCALVHSIALIQLEAGH